MTQCQRCLNEVDDIDNSLVLVGIYFNSGTKVCKKCGKEVVEQLNKLGPKLAQKSAALNFIKNKRNDLLEQLLDEIGEI